MTLSLSRLGSRTSVGGQYRCSVRLLDDSELLEYEFYKHTEGQKVLDYVCEYLHLIEKDYFGIRFIDQNKQRYWLDMTKPIHHQIRNIQPITLSFRVKFYPGQPSVIQEEITRYYIFMQLRRDLLHGRLYCPPKEAPWLGALILQSELGGTELAGAAEVSEYKLFLKQTSKLEEDIAQAYPTLINYTSAEAELEFISRAVRLDTYGFDPYAVKESKTGCPVYLGATHKGLMVFETNKKLHHMKWDEVDKIDYVGKELTVFRSKNSSEIFSNASQGQTSESANANGNPSSNTTTNQVVTALDNKLTFKCPSATFCKHLWKFLLEQRAFFTSQRAVDVRPQTSKLALFRKRSTFRYRGRVLNEIASSLPQRREQPFINRSHLSRQPSKMSLNVRRSTDLNSSFISDAPTDVQMSPVGSEFPSPRSVMSEPGLNVKSSYSCPNGWGGLDERLVFDSHFGASLSYPPLEEIDENMTEVPKLISIERRIRQALLETELEDTHSTSVEPTESKLVEEPVNVQQTPVVSAKTVAQVKPDSLSASLVTYGLSALLVGILLVSLVVLIMEVPDENVRSYLDQSAVVDAFRHRIYEPFKHRFSL